MLPSVCVTWNWLYWLPTPEDEVSKIDSSAKVEVQSKSRKRKRAEHNQGGAGGKQKEEHTGGKKEEEPPFASTEFDEESMATALSVSTVPWPNRYITPGDRFTHVVTVVPTRSTTEGASTKHNLSPPQALWRCPTTNGLRGYTTCDSGCCSFPSTMRLRHIVRRCTLRLVVFVYSCVRVTGACHCCRSARCCRPEVQSCA